MNCKNMKHIILTFLVLTSLLTVSAQNINFNLADPQPELMEVYGGSILSGDLDGDGDMDLVQSGLGENLTGQSAKATVFLNDGVGNFTIKEQNFNNFWTTERMVMGDLDNDEDLDLIITSVNRTDLYKNDGQAQFIHDDNTPFEPSEAGELIIGDVDGDGDNDVLQFGSFISQAPPFASLFINDGSGTFTLLVNTDFTPLTLPQIEFIDLEGDGDLDILSFGKNDNDEPEVGVYENDGSGNYSVFSNSNISPFAAEEISVGDIDNDGDDDFLISGQDENSDPRTILYINDGNGQFFELTNTSFPDIFASSNAFADLDNDNDLDILLIGSLNGGLPNIFSIVFENLGNNNFVATDSLGGEYIPANTIADFNGDGKKDIIIQGFVDDTNIYWNETLVSTGDKISANPPSIFPNPTNGILHLNNLQDVTDIQVSSMNGQVLFREKIIDSSTQLDISNFTSGMYLLEVRSSNELNTYKIIKF